jgi:hypothetical protein
VKRSGGRLGGGHGEDAGQPADPIATLFAVSDGWAALLPDGSYTLEGIPAFWYTKTSSLAIAVEQNP